VLKVTCSNLEFQNFLGEDILHSGKRLGKIENGREGAAVGGGERGGEGRSGWGREELLETKIYRYINIWYKHQQQTLTDSTDR